MIAVTGATGELGHLAVQKLLGRKVAPAEIVAAVRSVDKAQALAEIGVNVRHADYDKPETLARAFAGVEKLLLVSSSEVGKRLPQHRAAIAAARAAGVCHIVYTSLLRADTSPMALAAEHRATEAEIRNSGLVFTLLRNGWYTENYTGQIPRIREHGALIDCAGSGKIASASRADFAEAAAVVLTQAGHEGRTYELAGDTAYTLAEFASELTRQCGEPVVQYKNLSPEAYAEALLHAGLPQGFADILADSGKCAAEGSLFDDSHTLSRLIDRPTTSLRESIRAALAV